MAKLTLQNLVFEEPSSIYITAVSALTLLFLAYLGISEAIGKHLKYSKFWNVNSSSSPIAAIGQVKISSRSGMLLLYSPAAIFGVSSFFIFPDGEIRFLMAKAAVSIHFCKRVFELWRRGRIIAEDRSCSFSAVILASLQRGRKKYFLIDKNDEMLIAPPIFRDF